jgi:hypothetical protein
MRAVMGVMVFAGFLSGCAAAGVQVTEQQAQAFQVGRSTYADVVSALGEPTSVTSSSKGGRVAVYAYSAVSSRPQNFIPYVGYSNGILAETIQRQRNIGYGENLAAGSPQGGSNPWMPAR